MKLRNLIITGLMMIMLMCFAVGCDQDADVSGQDAAKIANSVPAIGFNISMKLPSYETIKIIYPDVTSDWLTNAKMDVIDAVWIRTHDGTDDAKFTNLHLSKMKVKKDNKDGTGIIYAGIADKSLKTANGLTLDVIPVKYKEDKENEQEKNASDNLYFLGNLKEYIIIDKAIKGSYKNAFDVTVDGIYSDLNMELNGVD